MKILQAVHTLILKHFTWKSSHGIPALKIIFMCLQVNDSIQLDLASNKVLDIIKFEVREMDCVSKENNFKHQLESVPLSKLNSRLETCAW